MLRTIGNIAVVIALVVFAFAFGFGLNQLLSFR